MALTGDGVFNEFWNDIGKADIDMAADQFTVVGINSTGVSNLSQGDADPTYNGSISSNSYNTHGPTNVSTSFSNGKLTATDLNGTFTDPNNGNGDTAGLVFYHNATGRLCSWTVLGSAKPQDGTDDDLTFGSNVVKLY